MICLCFSFRLGSFVLPRRSKRSFRKYSLCSQSELPVKMVGVGKLDRMFKILRNRLSRNIQKMHGRLVYLFFLSFEPTCMGVCLFI